jgi:dienelactone hydrolase
MYASQLYSRSLTYSVFWAVVAVAFTASVSADGPADNNKSKSRRIPKLGIEVSSADRAELNDGLLKLQEQIDAIRGHDSEEEARYLPDVEIFSRAVADALQHREFFTDEDVRKAKQLLEVGQQRAAALSQGHAPWSAETGLVVLGYVSRIDHSVQPYGLVIPANYTEHGTDRTRLDVWFHGRGETLSEVNFLDQRRKQVGRYAPQNTVVLHPYGRYCNAFKFAGEVDVLEALEDVRRRYRIDEDRIAMRGFSMGGAACWQFAVHYADRWFAANPGAGFSETPEFLRVFQQESLTPSWYEQKLWQLYDCPGYAANLMHCPTVAYSGELDRQKQAADVMEVALAEEGIEMVHVIGPQTKHAIHEDSKVVIENKLASLASRGRRRQPRKVSLVTYTLKYNRMHWVTVNGLGEHWEQARVEAAIESPNRIAISLQNVTDLSLNFPPGFFPTELDRVPDLLIRSADQSGIVEIAGSELPRLKSDRSWSCRVRLTRDSWKIGAPATEQLRKQHDLQGPIDDAFMDSFIFVRPGASCRHPQVDEWVQTEFEHAVVHWRQQFRGDARVKQDNEVDEHDIATANLVLFGDPVANSLLAQIADRLPIRWGEERLEIGKRTFATASHVPLLIYPNPLNPERYVVINSGFTYREYDYLNNARQVPKLPDWAVIDVRTPITPVSPGKIVDAGFFGERWEQKE